MKNEIHFKHLVWLSALLFLQVGVAAIATQLVVGPQPGGSVIVPNGQTITPAGLQIEVNDRPLGIAVSPDGNQAAVTTASNFAPRALHIIDLASQVVTQTISIGNSFVGLAYSPDGNTLYVGGGADQNIKIFARGAHGTWTQSTPLAIASS